MNETVRRVLFRGMGEAAVRQVSGRASKVPILGDVTWVFVLQVTKLRIYVLGMSFQMCYVSQ